MNRHCTWPTCCRPSQWFWVRFGWLGICAAKGTPETIVKTLHDKIVPTTLGKVAGGEALVGGNLAASIDFNNQLQHGIVPVFLFVMCITFILMLVAFGSITIAATTIGLNLLSVAAAYGVMVAVFQPVNQHRPHQPALVGNRT